ncbi:TonB-dependent hemoglobin/transferrin/lactoferrin family receptor [Comamonas testosteroni]|uniref:TonB-dependent hemoglobin/transferrin/lactoferrin family receptor n=1 Tax=Comamonas testosteroni (strain DSM 14576 / KF-1) TaxID=399795 RepID=B7X5S8_COMTK|nr:TonB-dependent hemoglobin/transferrin/lactoferrin family receptor [Comamonas testosteroni]EED68890.1 TonB-dependent hemoglobin/transferrin/lactoferrin family receptor [Comamonas testosteroni KF-1]WQG66885.1 TonB-dependent hemoglobin/transferrin/lactoferrin family receptor [Comamonas testosteroni]
MASATALHARASLAPRSNLRPLALASALACAAISAQAQQQSSESVQVAAARADRSTPVLRDVVISASRDEQDADSLPMTVDVIDAKQMEAEQIGDIRELAAKLPNVTVPRSPARFTLAGSPTGRDQNSGFNIRGLEGNRVLMLVDGVRLPRSYTFSANSFGRDYLDLGLVQRVEILRGAVPALYGSDGMGGLVNFITVQPDDLLKDGKSIGGRVSASYDGSDNGKRVGATIAGRASPEWSWLVSAGMGRSSALENMGSNNSVGALRTTPNPETDKSHSLLGKLVYTPSAVQKHVFVLEGVDKRADYDLLSARSATVTDSKSNTSMKRWRATWQGQWQQLDTALADELKLMASYQSTSSREFVTETRTPPLAYRERDVTYDEDALQLHAQAGKTLRWSNGLSGKFSYGVDYLRGKVVNEQNGITPPAGESFPLKRFPDTTETSTALFAQAELHYGAFSLTPGLRAEHYSIKPKQQGFGGTVVSNSDSAVSPKLGAMFQMNDAWSVYGNYAAGFRAPNAGQVNAFFENPLAFYRSIPNPDLKAEKSNTFELGMRGRVNALRLDAAVFTGRYKDFIQDQVLVSGNYGDRNNPATFQSVNLNRVHISGFELKADYDWGKFAGGDWRTNAAYGYTKGTDKSTDLPVDTISPQQLVLGVRYDRSNVGVQFSASHWAGKKAGDAAANAWLSPSATVLDLSAQWRIRPGTRLNVGVYNLTDKKYWRWSDVRSLTNTTQIADAYSQAGRYVRVSLVQDF